MEKKHDNENQNEDQAEMELTAMEEASDSSDAQPGDDVRAALEQAQKEVLYARADLENTRKRLLREQEQAVKFGNERIVRDLLGIVDLFDRAMLYVDPIKQKSGGSPEVTNFLSGIDLTHRELIQLLGRFGVEFIGQPGEKFDPAKHEALSQQETTEDKNGLVLQVVQRGCLLHGRLLQPAKVIVGVTNS